MNLYQFDFLNIPYSMKIYKQEKKRPGFNLDAFELLCGSYRRTLRQAQGPAAPG